MGNDATHNLIYFLRIPQEFIADLANIRYWSNLKVAFDGSVIWIRDFDYAQIESVAVKKIPTKNRYYEREGKLIPIGSLLPECTVPNLLWTPISRALPIKLPTLNHNYFGLHEAVEIRLIPAEITQEAFATIVHITDLTNYLNQAPAVRLLPLQWLLVSPTEALIKGIPQLPVPGKTYWKHDRHLLPAGWDFELSLLSGIIYKKIAPEELSWIFWTENGRYLVLPESGFRPLTLSSVRATLHSLQYLPHE